MLAKNTSTHCCVMPLLIIGVLILVIFTGCACTNTDHEPSGDDHYQQTTNTPEPTTLVLLAIALLSGVFYCYTHFKRK